MTLVQVSGTGSADVESGREIEIKGGREVWAED